MRLGLIVAAALAACSVAWAAPVSAQQAGTSQGGRSEGSAQEAEQPGDGGQQGTYFIGELNGGATVTGGIGLSSELVVGAGGKLVGFPWRFYVIAGLGYATAGAEGRLEGRGESFDEHRSYLNLSLGLRTYIPIVGPMRLFLDAMGGGSRVKATMVRSMGPPLTIEDWHPLGVLGGGVQARVLHQLSIGLRGTVMFTSDGLADLRESLQVDTPRPVSLTATFTWHF